MSKYKPLGERLRGHPGDEWKASFSEIEEVLGFPLPKGARGRSWWANDADKPHVKSWTGAGWQADVEPGAEAVTFRRGAISPAVVDAAAGLAPVGDLGDIELDMPPPPSPPYADPAAPALQAAPSGEPKSAAAKRFQVPRGLGLGAALAGAVAVVAGLSFMLFRRR